MKPGCYSCRKGKCLSHKTSPLRIWWNHYGIKRWYWAIVALIKGKK
jgi:hypothetical protein